MNMYSDVVEIAKRRGFFWPSFSIYGGFSGLYDYGPLGVLLKDNIINKWKKAYLDEGAIFIDTPNITPGEVFDASGHLSRFSDIAAECDSCKSKFKIENVLAFNKIEIIPKSVDEALSISEKNNLKCPVCGNIIKKIYNYNLMFRLENSNFYLRPETAQGIFVNFKLLSNYYRGKLPMAVAQLGKGFRNEISPRQSLIRLREFSQGEVEVFFDPENEYWKDLFDYDEITLKPNTGVEYKTSIKNAFENRIIDNIAMAYFILKTQKILNDIGFKNDNIRFRQHDPDERAHYASDSWDAEARIDDDWVEIVGIANRTNYDLKNHDAKSSERMSLKINNRDVIPNVIEPSYGIDRITLALMVQSYHKNEKGYNVLSFKPEMAPYHFAVLPLIKKENFIKKSMEIYNMIMSIDSYVYYDETGSIGKRYSRQDEIGTPFCITIDYETLENDSVTVRFRDTGNQERIDKKDLLDYLSGKLK
ncbi:glycyl-tRNA synthetase [Picrophilus oshimae DSM 9789]|uniref:glycine--tRNA ligase n=2 Tax=Picrophilus oshimae TaxID=46632 RepID=Q6L003_PICTO|nr:glycyl-tRNA synthetase [Picrophilus oshimae DSM 9789]